MAVKSTTNRKLSLSEPAAKDEGLGAKLLLHFCLLYSVPHVQKEEKKVEKAIRDAAKRGDMGSAKALAKELVQSRKAVNRLYENKAQLNSISMHLGEIVAFEAVALAKSHGGLEEAGEAVAKSHRQRRQLTGRPGKPQSDPLSGRKVTCKIRNDGGSGEDLKKLTVGHLSKSTEVMKLVNNLMKAPEIAVTMQEFSKEMTKAGVMEEMVNDAMDSALDDEGMEEEIEEEVDKVLSAIAGETASQLPDAVRKQKEKVTQPSTSEPAQIFSYLCAIFPAFLCILFKNSQILANYKKRLIPVKLRLSCHCSKLWPSTPLMLTAFLNIANASQESFHRVQRTAVAESVDDDDDDLEKIRERLAKVRS
ncbi:Vacuolar protein sorting-associated protein 24-like protein 1 [Triticum urartu]|uniref:Vacuolar protein sorting-associated protein 24-like protein 1 n=1 Tax=Triticum urartu TaxID=4572 RepID=M7YR69_TRIUA|nr:Vacuolar protein sorting-associated protein 24-like protein 1 [Triticum urartu]